MKDKPVTVPAKGHVTPIKTANNFNTMGKPSPSETPEQAAFKILSPEEVITFLCEKGIPLKDTHKAIFKDQYITGKVLLKKQNNPAFFTALTIPAGLVTLILEEVP